jgi:hypothetical protein
MALTLIAMPMLLGISLLAIDMSRANNLQTDLQNAVDAIAIAGGRELDGGTDSIDRAKVAMEKLVKNEARFADGGPLFIEKNQVNWKFFSSIPASDDTPMNPDDALDEETQQDQARYVWVYTSPNQQMTSLFLLPPSLANGRLTIGAQAVATYDVSACDVTPIYVCNPYEPDPVTGVNFLGTTETLDTAFGNGELYGRQFDMLLNGGSTAGPGNFGFLAIGGSGGNALEESLATSSPGECYSANSLPTKPGGTIGPVDQGLNVRFDMYSGDMKGEKGNSAYRPARNVRKGNANGADCNNYTLETDNTTAMALPYGSAGDPLPGGYFHSTVPNINDQIAYDIANGTTTAESNPLYIYFLVNHPGTVCDTVTQDALTGVVTKSGCSPDNLPADLLATETYPVALGPGDTPPTPSANDIYRWELNNSPNPVNALANPSMNDPFKHTAPNGEIGNYQCYTGTLPSSGADRRTIFAAMVNCLDAAAAGELSGSKDISQGNIEGFASFFLTKPMISSGSDKTISGEITDVSGFSGSGDLDTYLRAESYLVR